LGDATNCSLLSISAESPVAAAKHCHGHGFLEARNPSAKNKSVLRGATMKGVRGVMVMDCAVEAKAQQCGLQLKGSASDRCCRVWKSSRDGEPEGT
jgi:hypothetical protein